MGPPPLAWPLHMSDASQLEKPIFEKKQLFVVYVSTWSSNQYYF